LTETPSVEREEMNLNSGAKNLKAMEANQPHGQAGEHRGERSSSNARPRGWVGGRRIEINVV